MSFPFSYAFSPKSSYLFPVSLNTEDDSQLGSNSEVASEIQMLNTTACQAVYSSREKLMFVPPISVSE